MLKAMKQEGCDGGSLEASILGIGLRTPGYKNYPDFVRANPVVESVAGRDLSAVFSSGVGDADTMNSLYRTVNGQDKQVSPTVFHNSVHNAASGYWSINNKCTEPVNFICADQYSFSTALLESMLLANSRRTPVLMVVSDVVSPDSLKSMHAVEGTFAVALILSARNNRNQANSANTANAVKSVNCWQGQHLVVKLVDTGCTWPGFEQNVNQNTSHSLSSILYKSNAAARGLSLLSALQDDAPRQLALPVSAHASLRVTISSGENSRVSG